MEQKIKLSIIGLVGLLFISFIIILQTYSSKQTLERQLDRLTDEIASLRRRYEELSLEKRKVEDKVASLEGQSAKVSQEKEELQKKVDSLSEELAREKDDKLQIQETYKKENVTLKKQIEALKERKGSLEKELSELQEKDKSFEDRFTEMDTLLKDKMAQIENMKKQIDSAQKGALALTQAQNKESVELDPIVVRPQAVKTAQDKASLAGKVVAVNRDNNFVVIDLGKNSGVKISDTFHVYRNDKAIANLKTIQARDTIAACDIDKESKAIKIGDIVKP